MTGSSRASLGWIILSGVLAVGAASTLFALGAVSRHGDASLPDVSRIECPSGFRALRNTVTWYNGQNRLSFDAKEGCGDKQAEFFDLSDVTLFISAGGAPARLHASAGTFLPRMGRILLDHAHSDAPDSCLGDPSTLSVDLRTGELRMPGARIDLSSASGLPCRNHAGVAKSPGRSQRGRTS